jgi:hypothetical protein
VFTKELEVEVEVVVVVVAATLYTRAQAMLGTANAPIKTTFIDEVQV